MGGNGKRKEKKKEKSIGTNRIVYLLGGLIFLFIAFTALQQKNGYNAPRGAEGVHNFTRAALDNSNISMESIDESAKIMLTIEGDFPDGRQGTFFTRLRVNLDNIVANYGRVPKYMVFFESKKVPRLTVRYNLHDSIIEGGLPVMKSPPVEFLSPEFHNVTYTFREGSPQMIFFDGVKVAEGPYGGPTDLVTGMAVLDTSTYEIGVMDIDGASAITGEYNPE